MNKKVDLKRIKRLPTVRVGHFSSKAPTKNKVLLGSSGVFSGALGCLRLRFSVLGHVINIVVFTYSEEVVVLVALLVHGEILAALMKCRFLKKHCRAYSSRLRKIL